MCTFCNSETEALLCDDCLVVAWDTLIRRYATKNITEMKRLAGGTNYDIDGDAMTFVFASAEHEQNHDLTDANFVIWSYDMAKECTKYDREPLYAYTVIPLALGSGDKFWKLLESKIIELKL